MRRWLAILLLVLLPAQFSWAMVGQYCAHETGAESRHLGHHSHQHQEGDEAVTQVDVPHGDTAPWDAAGGTHADCEYCHLACGLAIMTPPAHTAPTDASVLPKAPILATGTHPADQPERPQWAHSRTPV